MLDPLAQAERLPGLAGRLEGVERLAVGQVADRVDGDRKAGARALADVLLELLAAGDLHTGAVEHARGLRAERAVHERLQVADAQQRAAEAAANVHPGEFAREVGRDRLPDAQAERALLVEPLPEAQRAEPAVLVV